MRQLQALEAAMVLVVVISHRTSQKPSQKALDLQEWVVLGVASFKRRIWRQLCLPQCNEQIFAGSLHEPRLVRLAYIV